MAVAIESADLRTDARADLVAALDEALGIGVRTAKRDWQR